VLPFVQETIVNIDGSIILEGSQIQLVVLYREPSAGNPLSYIQNPTPGQQITISIVNTANALQVVGNTGNILLDPATCDLGVAWDSLILMYKPGFNMWIEQVRKIRPISSEEAKEGEE
jgi:hypothetical protein